MRRPRHLIHIIAVLAVFVFLTHVAGGEPIVVRAAENGSSVQFTPQIGIPNSSFESDKAVEVTGVTFGEWIAAVYIFLSGVMGVLAAVMVLWGGIKWLTASGNVGRVQDAKQTIYSAIIALLLTFGAYTLLNTINPELVKIRDLSDLLVPLSRIDQLREAIPRRISEAILRDPGLGSEKNQFNAAACPTLEEMRAGFDVFLTGYYRPTVPPDDKICDPSGGYQNFPCNVGMQCRCARGSACGVTSCQAGSLTWKPCDMTKFDRNDYCNDGTYGKTVDLFSEAPVYTAAADPKCFGAGTLFTVSRGNDQEKPFRVKWSVMDTGPDVKGRHLDLFTGTGEPARAMALKSTGRATMRIQRYCTKAGDCQDLTAP